MIKIKSNKKYKGSKSLTQSKINKVIMAKEIILEGAAKEYKLKI